MKEMSMDELDNVVGGVNVGGKTYADVPSTFDEIKTYTEYLAVSVNGGAQTPVRITKKKTAEEFGNTILMVYMANLLTGSGSMEYFNNYTFYKRVA